MDWQAQLKNTQEKQPIKLKSFIEICCNELNATQNEVIFYLLTPDNETDIINGDISEKTLTGHIQLWINEGKQHLSGKTNKPNSLMVKEYKQEADKNNISKCEYCTHNTRRYNRCTARQLIFIDKWQRCKYYQFSGQYKAIQDKQRNNERLPAHYCKNDKEWLSGRYLTKEQQNNYSKIYLKKGRQAANLSILG